MLKFNSRKWHAWLSFILSLPILLVSVTAIFFAHGAALGFRDIQVDPGWLPGYADAPAQREVRATLRTADAFWIGTQVGLYRQDAQGIRAIAAFDGQEIRALLADADAVFVLTMQGLFVQDTAAQDTAAQDTAAPDGAAWQRVARGPVTSAYVDEGRLYALLRGKGLQVSDDNGASWRGVDAAQAALAALPALQNTGTSITLARLVRDLHTGEAIVGHDGEWIWNDVIGGAMTFLGLTGVYLWWKGQRRMVFAKRARKAMPSL